MIFPPHRRSACFTGDERDPPSLAEPTMQYDSLERAREELRGLYRALEDLRCEPPPDGRIAVSLAIYPLGAQLSKALALLEEI